MSRSTLPPLAAAALLLAAAGCGGGRPATGPSPAPAATAGTEQLGREPAIEAARPVPVSSSLLGSAHYDLPLEANQWVAAELDFLNTQRHDVIALWLQRADYYDQFVQDVFGRYGIPKDLHHLAMVESGYTPGARSRVGAVGMWQFMAGTARGMGLRVDDVVDERMDPVRATHAAARHLRDLNQAFNGDWALAVAAYNAGSGRISRGLRSYSVANFWDLAQQGNLADETKRYVPRLYAVTIIAHDPARFGYATPTGPVRRFAYDSVRVDVVTPLTDLAAIGGLPVAELATLNPHLVRGLAPAGYWVWTPAGTGAATQQAFQASEFRRSGGAEFYTVRRGDDVAKLADLVGIPADRIREMNPRVVVGGTVASGQKLVLPAAAARFLAARPVERVAARDDSTSDTDSATGLVRRRDRSQASGSGSGNATNEDTDAAPRTTRTASSGRMDASSSERPARSEDAERPSRTRTSERTSASTRSGDADRPARASESSEDEKPARSAASTSRSGRTSADAETPPSTRRTGDSEASSTRSTRAGSGASTRRASESGGDDDAAPAKPRRASDGESAPATRARTGSAAGDGDGKPSRASSSESGSRTSSGTREYVVKEDETLFIIARRFGVTVTQIREANDLGSSSVRPGRKLRIPRSARPDAGDDDTPARERSSASRTRSSESAERRSGGSTGERRSGESSATHSRSGEAAERSRSSESSSERPRSEGSSASRTRSSGESARGEASSSERSRSRASAESSSGESSSGERRRASGDGERSGGERSSATKPSGERSESSRGEAARNARAAGERAAERTSGEGASTRTRRTSDGESKPSREGEPARREGSSAREGSSTREGSSAREGSSTRGEGGRTRETEHTVKTGETLYSIARQYSVTVAALREANDLGERTTIAPGRKLRIPAPKS